MLRSCLFTAHAIARDMTAARREGKLTELRREFSRLAPELPEQSPEMERTATDASNSDCGNA